ncbi:craniofacial development protein 2-like [Toxorhynchites rutilus septentrionalis]|uniref:craniofacial development protein 2-like n=1 Tax=Toxorhynchites rutilus septentrionalis TaxID=329112 RepID=UPI002479D61C|nr:craniofacial development protein 2-like [Toxorhynchites rutilus septentrionalis]
MEWKLGIWNCRPLNFVGGDRILLELEPHKFGIVALQGICRKGEKVWKVRDGKAQFYQSGGAINELGTGFAINERMCVLRIKGRFYNYSIINVHCPHEGRPDDEKEAFYAQLEAIYDSCSPRDIKIVIGDMNAQVGREAMYRPVIGPCRLHTDTNDNGQRCFNFAASRGLVIRSTFFPRKDIHKVTWRSPDQHTTNQIDHVLIEGRFFSNITNIRSLRGADIDSDHYLVGVHVRSKLSRAYNSRQNRPPRFNIRQLKAPQAAENYARLLDEALPSSGELNASNLEDGWSKVSSTIEETATVVLGEETTSPRNDWFDGECQQAMERSKTARKNYLSIATRENLARYRRARNKLTTILRRKKRQQEDRDRDELEQLFQANDTRKFYEKVNQSRKSYTPNPDMCRDEEGNLITSEREVVDRWQKFFDKHLNGEIADGGVMETYLGAELQSITKPECTWLLV